MGRTRNIRRLIAVLCMLSLASAAVAGQWARYFGMEDGDRTRYTVNAEIFLLQDSRLTRYAAVQSVPVNLTFQPRNGMVRLAPGELETLHAFIFYSTVDYEGTTYASLSTVVCVPKTPHQPIDWEPQGFRDWALTGNAGIERDPRHALHQVLIDGEPALPPLPMASDKPWHDYQLWTYKDYDRAYRWDELEALFAAGAPNAFNVTLVEQERYPDGYRYPSTVVEDSIRVLEVSDDGAVTFSFNDIATATARGSRVVYDFVVHKKILAGISWREIARGSAAGVIGQREQRAVVNGVETNERCKVTITARWNSYAGAYQSQEIVHEFASIPGTASRGDDDTPPIHNLDLNYTGN